MTIIDDYAHHPTEIAATLKNAAHYPHKKLWCIFQPHTYTRTKALFSEFAEALAHADHVILADIYAARETDTLGISSAQLADAVKEHGCDATYLPSFAAIEEFVTTHCQPGDLLITMGARRCCNHWGRPVKSLIFSNICEILSVITKISVRKFFFTIWDDVIMNKVRKERKRKL